MARIVIVEEEVCIDCHRSMGEDGYEAEELLSDFITGGSMVKRKTKFSRCKKCQPIFDQKIKEFRDKENTKNS